MENGTLKDLAQYSVIGFNRAFPNVYPEVDITYFNLTDSGLWPTGGDIYYELSLNPDGRYIDLPDEVTEIARSTFTYLSNITGINFIENRDPTFISPNLISIDDWPSQAGAFTFYEGITTNDIPSYGELWISLIQVDATFHDKDDNRSWQQTLMHETLHALGLNHPGPYNGENGIAVYGNDSWSTSTLSYFPQGDVANDPNDHARPQTPMAADFLAIDMLYSTQGNGEFGTHRAFLGDTVYGDNTNVSDPILSKMSQNIDLSGPFAEEVAYCIVDGDGIDTLDFSGFFLPHKLDLTVTTENDAFPTTSTINGGTGSISLAVNTIIENAIGGSNHDEIIGNQYDNDLVGGFGDDTLRGDAGDDILIGGHGTDSISGGIGDDAIFGGEGNDILEGWAGADSIYDTFGDNQINAGHENDLVIVAQGTNNIIGSLGDDTLKGGNGNDTLVGGDGDDVLYGDTVLFSRAGDDLIRPGNGNDILQGGFGFDTFEFFATHTGANVIKRIDGGSDFDPTMDTIKLTGYGGTINANNIIEHISGGIGDAVITLDNQSITIVGISAFDFTNVPNLADLVFEFA